MRRPFGGKEPFMLPIQLLDETQYDQIMNKTGRRHDPLPFL